MEKLANPARRSLFRGKVHQKPSLRLPWVINETVFVDGCTQCQDCVSVCETKIIMIDQAGLPKVDFSQGQGECTFCNKCNDICEQPLFNLEKKQPWPASITISKNCLAQNHIYCQSCKDVCQSNAINFTLTHAAIPLPELNLDDCNSCGACIDTCPQNAIAFVDEKATTYV